VVIRIILFKREHRENVPCVSRKKDHNICGAKNDYDGQVFETYWWKWANPQIVEFNRTGPVN